MENPDFGTSHLVAFGYLDGTGIIQCKKCKQIGWNQDTGSENCRQCAEKMYWDTMTAVQAEYDENTLLEFRRQHEDTYGQYCDNSDFVEVARKLLVEDRGRRAHTKGEQNA